MRGIWAEDQQYLTLSLYARMVCGLSVVSGSVAIVAVAK